MKPLFVVQFEISQCLCQCPAVHGGFATRLVAHRIAVRRERRCGLRLCYGRAFCHLHMWVLRRVGGALCDRRMGLYGWYTGKSC